MSLGPVHRKLLHHHRLRIHSDGGDHVLEDGNVASEGPSEPSAGNRPGRAAGRPVLDQQTGPGRAGEALSRSKTPARHGRASAGPDTPARSGRSEPAINGTRTGRGFQCPGAAESEGEDLHGPPLSDVANEEPGGVGRRKKCGGFDAGSDAEPGAGARAEAELEAGEISGGGYPADRRESSSGGAGRSAETLACGEAFSRPGKAGGNGALARPKRHTSRARPDGDDASAPATSPAGLLRALLTVVAEGKGSPAESGVGSGRYEAGCGRPGLVRFPAPSSLEMSAGVTAPRRQRRVDAMEAIRCRVLGLSEEGVSAIVPLVRELVPALLTLAEDSEFKIVSAGEAVRLGRAFPPQPS